MTGAERIAAERARQVQVEGYGSAHDDHHSCGSIAMAAACYAAPRRIYKLESNCVNSVEFYDCWPWDDISDRRADHGRAGLDLVVGSDCPSPEAIDARIRELEKAGALVCAEIDRLLRLKARGGA